ncbi:MAG: GGDEF domain-containing protein [Wenzhouxiangella sp.]|jgi:diguanylate cyclase (GGDEF)-like protein|nr:GGDEF domain-containing protein [Wenzhouxiangella sp.]
MTELLMLDVRTVAFVSSVSGFLMGATLLGIYFAGMRTRAVRYWAAAGMSFGSGFLTGHLMQTLDVPVPDWFAATSANALIGLGHGMILLGVQSYLGRRPMHLLVGLGVASIILASALIPEVRESLRLRIILNSGWYILADVLAGMMLWRAHVPLLRRYHLAAALPMLLFAAFLAARLGYAVISPALTSSFVEDPFQLAAFLLHLVFIFVVTMALTIILFREKEIEVMSVARKDPLTGLHNRLSLGEFSEQALAEALRSGEPLSVVLLDIDHFKRFNDDFGHQTGDAILKSVAERLAGVLRDSDAAFRLGGEEFIIVLPRATVAQATQVAERIRSSLADAANAVAADAVRLTASFGVVEWTAPDETWDGLIGRADTALYQAKHDGRDRVVVPPEPAKEVPG